MATLTTSNGAPIGDDNHSLTAGTRGPTLLQDFTFIDKMAHFDREVIPERRVHARGAGAHGYFEVTADLTKYTKAKFLNSLKKQTPVFVRFSTVVGDRGTSDNIRDARGFAIKFYTEDGNYDIVGLNMPVFFIRDAIKFPDLIHSHKRNPQNNLPDHDAAWDFWSLCPESVHQTTILFTDRGTPYGYRFMNGYGPHAFKWVNAEGQAVWVKYHFKPEPGKKNFTAAESAAMNAKDPDFATRDLFNHIAGGGIAAWKAFVQIMPYEDAWTYKINPFDITKVWSHKDYPLIEFGRLVLNRNPNNFHAETEQSAFSPSHLVPGIEASPDPVLQGRLFSYPDTQRHRLGPNFQQIPINCPYMARVSNYQRDGVTFSENGGSGPNYWPNSLGGPAPKSDNIPTYDLKDVTVGRHAKPPPGDDYSQAGELYRKVLSDAERASLINNLASAINEVSREEVKIRAVRNFYLADTEYGTRLAHALGIDVAKVKS